MGLPGRTWMRLPPAHVGYYLVDNGRAALEDRVGYRPTPGKKLAALDPEAPVRHLPGFNPPAGAADAGRGRHLRRRAGRFQRSRFCWPPRSPSCLRSRLRLPWSIGSSPWPSHPASCPSWTCPGNRAPAASPTPVARWWLYPRSWAAAADVASLLRQIEQHYLRNPDPNLYFALLTDFGDAAATTHARRRRAAGATTGRHRLAERALRRADRRGTMAHSACSTASASGMAQRTGGSVGNANAANSTS